MTWLYVPSVCSRDTAGSIWDGVSQPDPARFVMSKGKPMRPASLQLAWKRASWIRRLSGLTCEPSTLSRGVDSWIASLAGSPARTCPRPESAPVSTASGADSGLTWRDSFGRFDPGTYSLRTSQACLLTQECDEYSETFPRWGSMRNGEVYARRTWAPAIVASGCSSWPTTTAQDAESSGRRRPSDITLTAAVRAWATPSARDHKGGYSDEAMTRRDGKSRENDLLPQMAERFSPQVRTTRHGQPSSSSAPIWLQLYHDVPPKHRRLNPNFSEWLMGLPPQWTNALTGCGPSATAWSRYRLRVLLAYCSIVSGAEGETHGNSE